MPCAQSSSPPSGQDIYQDIPDGFSRVVVTGYCMAMSAVLTIDDFNEWPVHRITAFSSISPIYHCLFPTARGHPYLTGIPLVVLYDGSLVRFVFALPSLVYEGCLRLLGFKETGVEAGSAAANFKSCYYGPSGIPAYSTFSAMQSSGATAKTWRSTIFDKAEIVGSRALGLYGIFVLGREWKLY